MGQTCESPRDNNEELQKIETTTAVARVYDPRLSPLAERRYKERCHYILQVSARSVHLAASQGLVVRKEREQATEAARREQRGAAQEGGGL